MPTVPLWPPSPSRSLSTPPNPLPSLLHTPSGLAIVEIQGSLHVPSAVDAHSGEPFSAGTIKVGKLVFPLLPDQNFNDIEEKPSSDAWMKTVYLYVGQHQRMTGEVKKLVKPLAVIRKKGDGRCDATAMPTTTKTNTAAAATTSNVAANSSNETEELEIIEIVNYKLVFSQRPEPVGIEDSAASANGT